MVNSREIAVGPRDTVPARGSTISYGRNSGCYSDIPIKFRPQKTVESGGRPQDRVRKTCTGRDAWSERLARSGAASRTRSALAKDATVRHTAACAIVSLHRRSVRQISLALHGRQHVDFNSGGRRKENKAVRRGPGSS